mgnify:CR=1 FL=1
MSWTFQEDEDQVYKYCKISDGRTREKYKFKKQLTFTNISRGRSAVTFWFEDQEGKRYPMFAGDFENLFLNVHTVRGRLPELEYIHTKKGQSIGIRVTPDQLDKLDMEIPEEEV